jgi:histidine phosphotransferase ChpT
LDSLDLAALLCSRVCHDVISPVGAIVNGLEVLEEEKDESMRGFAEDLIRKSARQASARLQFARLAFGAAGSAGAAIDIGDAAQIAKGFIEDDRITLTSDVPRQLLPKNQVKLFLNLLMIASSTIPRGGKINASVIMDDAGVVFKISTIGTNARIPAHLELLLRGESETGTVDAHSIQPYYTGLLAREAGMHISLSLNDHGVLIETS